MYVLVLGGYMKYYILLTVCLATLILTAYALPKQPVVAQLPTSPTSPHITPVAEQYYIIDRLQTLTTELATEPTPPRYKPSAWERKLLAALAEQEDSSTPKAMQAVVEVVLNRMDSDHYTWAECRTIEQVIYQAGYCNGVWVEQYQGADRLASAEPSDAAYEAVDRACAGERLVPDALFHAEASVPSWRIANHIVTVGQYGLTKFYALKGI